MRAKKAAAEGGGPKRWRPVGGSSQSVTRPRLFPAVMKTEWKDAQEWKVQNDNKPLWVRSPKDVSKDEYDAFFKTTFR